MRHRRKSKTLKRPKGQREALVKSLMRAVVMENAIITTESKAKAVRPKLERLITREKTGTLASHRAVIAAIGKDAAIRLRKDILPRLEKRSSGYLRITKHAIRKSNATRMAQVAFVD